MSSAADQARGRAQSPSDDGPEPARESSGGVGSDDVTGPDRDDRAGTEWDCEPRWYDYVLPDHPVPRVLVLVLLAVAALVALFFLFGLLQGLLPEQF